MESGRRCSRCPQKTLSSAHDCWTVKSTLWRVNCYELPTNSKPWRTRSKRTVRKSKWTRPCYTLSPTSLSFWMLIPMSRGWCQYWPGLPEKGCSDQNLYMTEIFYAGDWVGGCWKTEAQRLGGCKQRFLADAGDSIHRVQLTGVGHGGGWEPHRTIQWHWGLGQTDSGAGAGHYPANEPQG